MMKHDYNLKELMEIRVRGLKFNIMPRYKYHYTDNDYEKFSLDLLDSLVEENSVSIDIGSHYGIYSLLAAQKSKKVYAFEPVPENYEILKKNIASNKFEKIIAPINKAVSDTIEKVEFNITWASDSAGFYEHPNAEIIRKVEVQTATIDDELKDIKDVSFIKIDTEGHELHVLEGLKSTLKNNKDAKLLIEYNPECLLNAGCNSSDLLKKIDELGYDMFAIHEQSRGIVRIDAETKESDILLDQTYLNLLCLPKKSWQSMLFVSHSSDIGGAELVLLETIQELVKSKDKFVIPFIVFPGDGPLVERFKELPVPIKTIPMRGWVGDLHLSDKERTEKRIVNANTIGELSKIMSQFKPHVVCTNTLVMPWGAFVAKAYSIPHIWYIHEFGDLDHKLEFDYGYDESLRLIGRLSERVVVLTDAVKKHIIKYTGESKIKVLNYDIKKPSLSKTSPKSPFGKTAKLKMVISGRVMPSKGQLSAVKAVKELRSQNYEAELLILGAVGSTYYLDEIVTYCNQYNLSKYIHIAGYKENPFNYVDMADLLLMCSDNEAFGRVTVEAMLLGKPVVGSNSGGTSEIIEDGKNGYLFESGNVEDLVKKIKTIIDNNELTVLGDNARKHATLKYHNNTYNKDIKNILTNTKHHDLLYHGLFRDLLQGMYYEQDKQKNLEKIHRQELENFSIEYNKVYSAYRELENQLNAINSKKVVKIARGISRFKKIKRGRSK